MKYWPLIQSALLRRPAQTLLVLLAVTVGFALFGFMIALDATAKKVVAAARGDRIYVNARFDTPYGLPISLEGQLRTIDGVAAVGAFRWINGRYQSSESTVGVFTVDEGMRRAMAEYPITAPQWDALFSSGIGTLITQKAAACLGLHKGDVFHLSPASGLHQYADAREDGDTSWEFQVLDVVPDVQQWGDCGVAIGNYRVTENARSPESRDYAVGFIVAVRDPGSAAAIAARIDQRYANSGTPTQSISARAAAEAQVRSGVSVASMTWGVGTAGLFTIVFLTGNLIAQSVRRRIPELATLKAVGYTDARIAGLVLVEAAVPCCLGAILGTALAAVISAVPGRYIPRALSSVPHPVISLAILGWALAFALLIAFVGSIWPVWRLRRMAVAAAIAGQVR